MTEEQVLEQLKNIDGKKATTFQNIPCKLLKQNAEVCTPVLTKIINKEFKEFSFPNKLKNADITSIFKRDKKKKKDPTDTKNYRLVSVLQKMAAIMAKIKIFKKRLHQILENH